MNEELKEILQTIYQYSIEAQVADEAEAEVALREGRSRALGLFLFYFRRQFALRPFFHHAKE